MKEWYIVRRKELIFEQLLNKSANNKELEALIDAYRAIITHLDLFITRNS